MFATSTLKLDVRPARRDDLPALHDLVEQSVRGLLREVYSPRQIESSLKYLFGVDPALIEDGTYYVAEVNGNLAGAGGWSKRSAIYGHGDERSPQDTPPVYLDPALDAARIRAFFVHPNYAGRGIAHELLSLSESAAYSAGFRKVELVATWKGAPVYKSCGYMVVETTSVTLPDGEILTGLHMMKELNS
jgi:N-acetylglutamate synthase-like GNAT family acetyltransferase